MAIHSDELQVAGAITSGPIYVCACACALARACVRVCVHACMRVCVHACVRVPVRGELTSDTVHPYFSAAQYATVNMTVVRF